MWNIKTRGDAVCFYIQCRDIESVKNVLQGAELLISDKKGIPYILDRFRKRYALVAGVLFFGTVIAVLSSLVWKINITGCEITDSGDIESVLRDNGVAKWSFKNKIDEDYLEMRVMNSLETISWINIEVKGTVLNIKVKERRARPDMADKYPTDLIASKDGVVYALRIKNGEEAVDVGDTVIKGQLLVSSLVEKDGDYMLPEPYTVHSKGEVIARTWYTFDIKQPLFEDVCVYTGNEYIRRRVGISGFDINLYFKDIPYENYDIKQKKYGGFIRLDTEVVREIKNNRVEYSEEEAVEKAVLEAESQLPKGVLTTKCITREYIAGDGFVNLHIVFECTENIAEERRVTTDDSKDDKIQQP